MTEKQFAELIQALKGIEATHHGPGADLLSHEIRLVLAQQVIKQIPNSVGDSE